MLAGIEKIVCVLAGLFAAWAIMGTGWNTMLWGAVLMLTGLPIYFYLQRRQTEPEMDQDRVSADISLKN